MMQPQCPWNGADLYPMLYKRKSFHLFRNVGTRRLSAEQLENIRAVYAALTPLCPEIKTAIRILPAAETACKRGQEHCVFFYSQRSDNYLQNIGYLGEQLDLYLASQNIGTLWYGIGKAAEPYDGLDFVIMMAISQVDDPKKFRKDMFKSKRKPVDEIWAGQPLAGVTDIARFAPSACNTQPWLVRREGQMLEVHRCKKPGRRGIMPAAQVAHYNCIDMGIFLCFLELCLGHEGIPYERTLHRDGAGDDETALTAVYHLKES